MSIRERRVDSWSASDARTESSAKVRSGFDSASSLLKHGKVETQHLARLAMVYVRQSSARQVRENVESTRLQYDLANLAAAYGWPPEQTITIDDDLGVSGRSLEGRAGFQRLLAEISLGHVGIVMGIEMSRLARNCRDWHQLLFDKFAELGSANAVLRYFHDHEILVGMRKNNSLQPDDLTWHSINRSTILHILHHPMYAGAYVFGRHQSLSIAAKNATGKSSRRKLSSEEWPVLIHDHIPAYISWGQWEKNQKILRENSTKFGFGPSRGTSLLAGYL